MTQACGWVKAGVWCLRGILGAYLTPTCNWMCESNVPGRCRWKIQQTWKVTYKVIGRVRPRRGFLGGNGQEVQGRHFSIEKLAGEKEMGRETETK